MINFATEIILESIVKILGPDGQKVAGSGFIIKPEGYLLTCHHVIYYLDELKVSYKGTIYKAEWCEDLSNPEVDIAILKINITKAIPLPIIDKKDIEADKSEFLIMGFPEAQLEFFPEGFASFTNQISSSGPIKTFPIFKEEQTKYKNPWNILPKQESAFRSLRIDNEVYSGTSGGPLYEINQGGVVGVVQSSFDGYGFAICLDNIVDILEDLGVNNNIDDIHKFYKIAELPEKYIIGNKTDKEKLKELLEIIQSHAIRVRWLLSLEFLEFQSDLYKLLTVDDLYAYSAIAFGISQKAKEVVLNRIKDYEEKEFVELTEWETFLFRKTIYQFSEYLKKTISLKYHKAKKYIDSTRIWLTEWENKNPVDPTTHIDFKKLPSSLMEYITFLTCWFMKKGYKDTIDLLIQANIKPETFQDVYFVIVEKLGYNADKILAEYELNETQILELLSLYLYKQITHHNLLGKILEL